MPGPMPVVDADPAPLPTPTPAGPREAEAPRPTWAAVRGGLVGTWAAGASVLAVRLMLGLAGMTGLRRRARPIDAEPIAGVLDDVHEAFGARPLPPIVEVDWGLDGPVTAGVFRPVVVLPRGLADRLGAEGLRDVLVHEVAHAARRDGLVGLLQRVAALAFWPHPLVHRLNRRLSRAREEACDDVVLGSGDPCRYARTLLQLAEGAALGRGAGVVGLFEAHWRLEDRVARVLDPGRSTMTRANRWWTLSASALLALSAVAAAAVRPGAEAREVTKAVVEEKGADDNAWRAGPGTGLRGTVVDEAGAPVVGASVRAKGNVKSDDVATSGADGRFLLRVGGHFLARCSVVAEADGGTRLGHAVHDDLVVGPPELLRIVLKPARPLTVRVADAAGKPVAGAVVLVRTSAFDPFAVDPGTTNAQGVARLRVPANAGVETVTALKDGVGANYFENYRSRPVGRPGPPPPEVSLTLDGARTVTVTAVGSDGRPVPGLTLAARLGRLGKLDTADVFDPAVTSKVTDAGGVARFPWIPSSGAAWVGLISRRGYSARDEVSVGVDAKGDVSGTIRVIRDGRLSGRVTHPDGSPARGIMVRAQGSGNGTRVDRAEIRTGDDGTYTLSVEAGCLCGVAVVDRDHAATPHFGLSIGEGESREGLDFRLIGGTRLHGRITVQPGPAPELPPRVMMTLRGPDLPAAMQPPAGLLRRDPELKRRFSVLTGLRSDDEGRYEIRLAPGEYEIRDVYGQKSEFLRVDGTGELVRDFSWSPPVLSELTGLVVDASPGAGRRPVPGVVVRVVMSGTVASSTVRARSDADGRFALKRGATGAALYAKDSAGTLAALVDVPQDVKDVVVPLAPAATVSGRLVGADGRTDLPGQLQIRRALGPEDGDKGSYSEVVRCDPDGRFRTAGLVPGLRYRMVFFPHQGSDAWKEITLKTFPIAASGPVELGDLVIPAARPEPAVKEQAKAVEVKGAAEAEPETMLRGTVVDEAGAPAVGAKVELLGGYGPS